MKPVPTRSFGAHLKALREAAGFTQEELATIAGLSVHAVSALERGERRRPQFETVRSLSSALDLPDRVRDELLASARVPVRDAAVDELSAAPLPQPVTPLLGRERDLELLLQWLADPGNRLITLLGPGGVGKTRLALELAHALAGDDTTRIVFTPLATIRDPGLAACAIAEGLGLADINAADLPRRARAACERHPTLLVLDNFEQVIEASPLVADLLTSVMSLRVLVTSRAPLRVRGEREYALGPLALEPGIEAVTPADLASAPAVRLFAERVRAVQPHFQLTPANADTVVAICRRLDALPLALELAAPWMKVLTPDDLLRRLEQDVLRSTAGARDLPERQQTMNATVAWSYQLLSAVEQRAFRRLGALPGRFSIDAATAVIAGHGGVAATRDETLGTLADLIDKSLLLQTETPIPTRPLFQMLETVRTYAAHELALAGERDDVMQGLARYCMNEVALAAEGLVGHAQVEWLNRVYHELETYRDAQLWLSEHGRPAAAADIAWGLLSFWFIRGHTAEGLWWYEQTLKTSTISPTARARSLVGAGMMWYGQGALDRAGTALTDALTLARSTGDTSTVPLAEILLGHVEYAGGNMKGAGDRFTNSLEGFRALAIPWGTGNALTGLAGVAFAIGDAEQAERLLDEATSALRQAGPWYLTLTLYVRAMLAVRKNDLDTAIAVVRHSLTLIRALHDKFCFVQAMVPLAAAAALKGDDAWAARILGARDAVIERSGVSLVDSRVHDLREHSERDVRLRLGPDRWAEAYSAGRTSSVDAMLKDIDRVLGQALALE
jgi:predicted ATPase/DNA-binding XRE family transcriptional regulator